MPKAITTQLKPASRGGYVARKWLPPDVRDAYHKLYGQQHEAWFNSGAANLLQARALHREWSSLIESRIANIRDRHGVVSYLTLQRQMIRG